MGIENVNSLKSVVYNTAQENCKNEIRKKAE